MVLPCVHIKSISQSGTACESIKPKLMKITSQKSSCKFQESVRIKEAQTSVSCYYFSLHLPSSINRGSVARALYIVCVYVELLQLQHD